MNIFLHIGHHKTGTTSFQRLCDKFRDSLMENGIHYPLGQGQYGHQHGQVLRRTGQEAQRLILEDWLSKPCETLILSAERLVKLTNGDGKALVERLKARGRVQIIYTIRDWSEYLRSRYAQFVRLDDSWHWMRLCPVDVR